MAYRRRSRVSRRSKSTYRRRTGTSRRVSRRRAAPRAQTVRLVIEQAPASVAAETGAIMSARETKPQKARF